MTKISSFERPPAPSQFLHPMTGSSSGVTTYHRKNMNSLIFERSGQIKWSSNTNATVEFGVEVVSSIMWHDAPCRSVDHQVSIKDLRKVKNATSQ